MLAISSAPSRVPNCTKATNAEPAVSTSVPRQGTKFSTPATTPHTAACSRLTAAKASPTPTPSSALVNNCISR